jgi:hypothetical protein
MIDDDTIKAFEALMDDSTYVPDPVSLEGMEAYFRKVHRRMCPYKTADKKERWLFGWDVTDIGHIKAGDYVDPKYWPIR